MVEDVIDYVEMVVGFELRDCVIKWFNIYGYYEYVVQFGELVMYGFDVFEV